MSARCIRVPSVASPLAGKVPTYANEHTDHLFGELVVFPMVEFRQLGKLAGYHKSVILPCMAKAISVRLDADAERALRLLEAAGMSQSEAIRSSLLASAHRLRRSKQPAAEVAALEADEADRAEMRAVAELMESLRAER